MLYGAGLVKMLCHECILFVAL